MGSPESAVKVKSGARSPSRSGKATSKRRAVGIVRVSRRGGRAGQSYVSPTEQEERIRAACKREGLRLLAILPEEDVSGGAPLERRPGLSRAVGLIEAHKADVVVAAYFDRFFRGLSVQAEVVERVERAGGSILAVDVGQLTNGSAGQWLSGTMLGAVAEYHRRATAERTREAKERAVARGVAPFPNLPFWLGRRDDAAIEHDPAGALIARDAIELRLSGATIMGVRAFLAERGVELSFNGVRTFLTSRLLLGELHFGAQSNLDAFPELIDAATYNRLQHLSVPRGRRPKSERLLARLGVLRCATCGSRMVVGFRTTRAGKRYEHYRCPPVGDCPQRVTVAADMVEQAVERETRRLLAGMKGKASARTGAREAARAAERAQAELDSATRTLIGAGLENEAAAIERLQELREARDAAAEKAEELDTFYASLVIDADRDWDLMNLDERRALLKAVLSSVTVAPGRGLERLTFEARVQ